MLGRGVRVEMGQTGLPRARWEPWVQPQSGSVKLSQEPT